MNQLPGSTSPSLMSGHLTHDYASVFSDEGSFCFFKKMDVALKQAKKDLTTKENRLSSEFKIMEDVVMSRAKESCKKINDSLDTLSSTISTTAQNLVSQVTNESRSRGNPVQMELLTSDIIKTLIKSPKGSEPCLTQSVSLEKKEVNFI